MICQAPQSSSDHADDDLAARNTRALNRPGVWYHTPVSTSDGHPPHQSTMTDDIQHFIARWQASGAAERANYQLFLSELCDVLDVPRPDPTTPDEAEQRLRLREERPPAPRRHRPHRPVSPRLLRAGGEAGSRRREREREPTALSLEGEARARGRKKGVAPRGTAAWDTAMEKARQQAQSYARNLPPDELKDGGRPPFLIVVDVGESLALYSEFTRTGGNYVPFPNPLASRIALTDLRPARGARAAPDGLARPHEPGPGPPRGARDARDRGPAGAAGPGAGAGARSRRGRPLPDALPVHHVCGGRGPAPRGQLHPTAGRRAAQRGPLPPLRRGAVVDHGARRLLAGAAAAHPPLQRRAVRGRLRRCP